MQILRDLSNKLTPPIVWPALILAAAAIFGWQVARFWPFTVDDAFITLRYSANLAAGYGLIFNPGQPPAEGYTTFLWMLVGVIPHALKIDAVVFVKWAGVLCGLGTGALVFLLSQRLSPAPAGHLRRVPPALATLLYSVLWSTGLHAVSGMETALFSLLVTALFYALTVYVQSPSGRLAAWIAALCLLAGLTRPEGNLIGGVGVFAGFWLSPRQYRWPLARAVALGFLLPGAAYFVWRYAYYGLLLPLPFYVKVTRQGLLAGLPEVTAFVVYAAIRLGPPVVVGAWQIRRAAIPALIGAAALMVFYLFPAHIMGYSWRYLVPILPLLCALAGVGVAAVLKRADNLTGRRKLYARIGVLGAVLVAAGLMIAEALPQIGAARWYAFSMEYAHLVIGRRLAEFPVQDDRPPVIALADAGAIPYYSGWQTIDYLGLNEPHIALNGPDDPAYVLAQHPDLLLLHSTRDDVFEAFGGEAWVQALYEASVEAGMAPVRVVNFNFYRIWIMAYPDSPAAAYVAGW